MAGLLLLALVAVVLALQPWEQGRDRRSQQTVLTGPGSTAVALDLPVDSDCALPYGGAGTVLEVAPGLQLTVNCTRLRVGETLVVRAASAQPVEMSWSLPGSGVLEHPCSPEYVCLPPLSPDRAGTPVHFTYVPTSAVEQRVAVEVASQDGSTREVSFEVTVIEPATDVARAAVRAPAQVRAGERAALEVELYASAGAAGVAVTDLGEGVVSSSEPACPAVELPAARPGPTTRVTTIDHTWSLPGAYVVTVEPSVACSPIPHVPVPATSIVEVTR